ncbi:hypothetical protein [Stenotrophomonas sp. 59]|uniref:hypothetical protein n=1 Tax=Stenotrophomonas sp. 59 TaxID=3051120 RepID=UPI00256EA020|nr:hypothetical protein [Stenotrophomonas sp. 59]
MAKDDERDAPPAIGSGYIGAQMTRALRALQEAANRQQRQSAQARVDRWSRLLDGKALDLLQHGSRTPIEGAPAWATPEVVTGGFATGALLAGGPLLDWERHLAAQVLDTGTGNERQRLNAWCLGDEGMAWLHARLQQGDYRVGVPEESALLTVAWLLQQGAHAQVEAILAAIVGWFPSLRFYPEPVPLAAGTEKLPAGGDFTLFVETAGAVVAQLQRRTSSARVKTQHHVLMQWRPLYATAVGVFLQTWRDGQPCMQFPQDWLPDAKQAVATFRTLRRQSPGRKASRHRDVELLEYLALCVDGAVLTPHQRSRVGQIVNDHVGKHGVPDSDTYAARMRFEQESVAAPPHAALARIAANRLRLFPADAGVVDVASLQRDVQPDEATSLVAAGSVLPRTLRQHVARCQQGTVEQLIEAGLVPSLESLALLLPQLGARVAERGFTDPAHGRLYAACRTAFDARRSLLLLNLQSQVRMAELPWAAGLESERQRGTPAARRMLADIVALALRHYPETPLPNPLLRQLRSLADSAGADLPLVEELAADIFMGAFAPGFAAAARHAGRFTAGSLYARYYGIDSMLLERLGEPRPRTGRQSQHRVDDLAGLCLARADLAPGQAGPAANGAVIEQVQILTTHNLAVLFDRFQLDAVLAEELPDMIQRGFSAVCTDLQQVAPHWHAWLTARKRGAYAWRQMVFFLSRLDDAGLAQSMATLRSLFAAQPSGFQRRFAPAMDGLVVASQGGQPAQVLLGWSPQSWLRPATMEH